MDDKFKQIYLEEASELLNSLEDSLLRLENDRNDTGTVEAVFRVMHTFKGSSNMFGLEKIGEFTHHLETVYDQVRLGQKVLDDQLLSLTLQSLDHLREIIRDPFMEIESNSVTHSTLLEKILQLAGHPRTESIEKKQPNQTVSRLKALKTYYIHFSPHADALKNGSNPIYAIDELYDLGKCRVVAQLNNIPDWQKFKADACYVSWDIFLATEKGPQDIENVFVFFEGICELRIESLAETNLLIRKAFGDYVRNLQATAGPVDLAEVKSLVAGMAEPVVRSTGVHPVKGDGPVPAVDKHNIADAGKASKNMTSSIRVSSEKLDNLMNLVSELITTQARLTLLAETNRSPEIVGIAENVEKISRQLRDNAFNICLIPVENMVTRFQRLVRDLSKELGKEVKFVARGTDTELDKTIIESLIDPLMHILRNCLDHGIESPGKRLEKGKPAHGTIILHAFYSGTHVHILIKDDGAGIDRKKIRSKAVEKGLIGEEDRLTDPEIYNLLFAPGFSTAEKVTDVSGRGVGMDVVKRNIQELRGEIAINSSLGEGTTTTIKLPLTLSVIDGLLVRIGNTRFVIPLPFVDKCYEVPSGHLKAAHNYWVTLDGEQVPYCYLRREFDIHGECPETEQVIVVKYEDKRVGLTADEVIGEYQAVIKPLGKMYRDIQIISGATILGDGTIALVVDSNRIIHDFMIQMEKEKTLEI